MLLDELTHDKTEILLIASRHRICPPFECLRIGNVTLSATTLAGSLGVIVDKHMFFDVHVSAICESSSYHLRNLARIRKYLRKEPSAIVVYAFATSRLDYSSLFGSPKY